MKTITEFNGFTLRNAVKTFNELTAAGKTPEEVQAGMGEAFKLEGDKLKYLLNAIDVAKAKSDQVKRVLVMSLAENEKAPSGAQQKDEQYYLTEFIPQPPSAKSHGKHDDRREGKGRGGKRGDKRGRRGDQRREGSGGGPGGGEKRAGERRPPRGPRPGKPSSEPKPPTQ